MPFIHDVGKVLAKKDAILWTIQDFFTFPQEVDSGLWSPQFKFLNKKWQIGLWPNGWKQDSSEGWIGIGLMNRTDKASLRVRVGLKGSSGETVQSQDAEWDGETWFDSSTFIPRSEFESRKDEMAKDGTLTVVCEISVQKDSSQEQAHGETSAEKEPEDEDDSGKNKKKHPSFYEYVENARQLLSSCKDFDVVLRVKGFEYRVHRSILIDRCGRFKCILNPFKNSDIIYLEVDDVEPDAFREFLLFLYTGVIDGMDTCNVLDMYYVAKQYNSSELIEKCLEFMEKNLESSQTVQVLEMVVKLRDKKLLKLATKMFTENVEEILPKNEWYNFLSDHPGYANYLFIKAVRKLKKQR